MSWLESVWQLVSVLLLDFHCLYIFIHYFDGEQIEPYHVKERKLISNSLILVCGDEARLMFVSHPSHTYVTMLFASVTV